MRKLIVGLTGVLYASIVIAQPISPRVITRTRPVVGDDIVTYDGTTGFFIQDSGVPIDSISSLSETQENHTANLPMLHGSIKGLWTHWVDTDTLLVSTGACWAAGDYMYQTSGVSFDVSGVTTAREIHHVYLDKSGSTNPTLSFYNATNIWVWNNEWLGYYHPINTNDRGVSYFYSAYGTADILAFRRMNDGSFSVSNEAPDTVLQWNGNPTGNWQEPITNMHERMPVGSLWVRLRLYNSGVNVHVAAASTEHAEINEHSAPGNSYHWGQVSAFQSSECHLKGVPLSFGPLVRIKWAGEGNDNNAFNMLWQGGRIGR
jgi:hypothetical protein